MGTPTAHDVDNLCEHGLPEGNVALISSLVFGLVHLSNVVGRGASAIPQAVIASLAGFVLIVRRHRISLPEAAH